MSKLFFFICLLTIVSCSKPEISIDKMDAQNITSIDITSIKKMKGETYYSLSLDIGSKEVKYDYDDNREVVIGDFVKDVGIIDASGAVNTSEKTLNQLLGKLKTLSNKASKEGLIKTTIALEAKDGKCTIVTSDLYSTQEFERFIQSSLLQNKMKILMN